jgi:glyoxylase-like metal-dependent hydrolase (beta-lactamase superfamily II)
MHERITGGIFQVGGGAYSGPSDCLVYALDLGEVVLVDCGCGPSWPRIRENVRDAGLGTIHTLVLTHAHVDHIGAAPEVARETGCRVVAHTLDADAIESGDEKLTAAGWYGLALETMHVDHRMQGQEEALELPGGTLHLLHAPGHTPGSIVAWIETDEGRVLFGQDVHGPFSPSFGSDVQAWRASMRRLMDLEAEILCEGHYGIFRGRDRVRSFIREQLEMNR